MSKKDDLEHLRHLATFHFVAAGLSAICALFPLLHVAVGVAIVTGNFVDSRAGPGPPAFVGWAFIFLSAASIVAGWCFAICLVVAGRLLQRRHGYTFCLVTAAIACLFMPLGTVLGVFTLIVLLRPGVKDLFGEGDRATVNWSSA